MISQLRELDMHLLLVFQSLSQTGSVTHTAEKMRLSQGAISHSLKKLRELFGDPLFVRSPSGLVPTTKAEQMAAQVDEIVGLSQSLLTGLAGFDPPSAERTITIAMSDVGAVATLPTLLRRMAQEAPHCRVMVEQIRQHRLAELVEAVEIDLLITGLQPRMGGLRQQKLYRHSYAVLASRENTLPASIELDQYCRQKHVSASTARTGSIVDDWLKRRGWQRQVVLTTPHVLTLPYLLDENPELVATVPSFLVDKLVAEGRYRRIDVGKDFLAMDIFQYWPDKFHHDTFSCWLREVVRSCFLHHSELHM
ncbi:ABC transporter substrate-binding protein [Altererythrobacter sp. B11]|uniref:LysR family transcriptional regulator n=1 Tax=Altererythrobacter sp. B11 TaxID=2060312 RepID=UPI000DC73241|nr:LysR family transcriptional regulator [Altererythrobacter sp. B11]BBC71136.1 ABC transporter substrate-binding protein [Altererythrobacter sp. B11]